MKIKLMLIVLLIATVISTIGASCNKENTIRLSPSSKWSRMIENNWLVKQNGAKYQTDKAFKAWIPNEFSGIGEIKQKWTYDNKGFLTQMFGLSFKKGWIWGFGSKYEYLPNSAFIPGYFDPAKGFMDIKEFPQVQPEITMNDLVWGYSQDVNDNTKRRLGCWNTETGEYIWQYKTSGRLVSIGKALFYIANDWICSINPFNGNVLWQIKGCSVDSIVASVNYMWFRCANRNINIDKNNDTAATAKEPNDSWFRLDPQTGEVFEIEDKRVSNIYNHNEDIWMLLDNNELTKINEASGEVIERLDLMSLIEAKNNKVIIKGFVDNCLMVTTFTIESIEAKDNTIDLQDKGGTFYYTINLDNPRPVEPLIKMTGSGSLDREVQIINNTLIVNDGKKIAGYDPKSFEMIWWFDTSELGPNPYVAWLDDRGILVGSDTKLACFAP